MKVEEILEKLLVEGDVPFMFRFEEGNATTIRYVNKFIKVTDEYIYYYRDCLQKVVMLPIKIIERITLITGLEAREKNKPKILIVEIAIKVTKENKHFIW